VPSGDKGTILSEGTGQDIPMNEASDESTSLTVSRYLSALPPCKALLMKANKVNTSSSYFINDISQLILIMLIQASWNM
jgi:hypothetical protein